MSTNSVPRPDGPPCRLIVKHTATMKNLSHRALFSIFVKLFLNLLTA